MNALMLILTTTAVTVSSVEAPQEAEDNTVVQSARTVPARGPWTAGATSLKAQGACQELTSENLIPLRADPAELEGESCGEGQCIPPATCENDPEDCGECPCLAGLVYDNGLWTAINGGGPPPGWTQAGLIDDFVLPDPDLGGTSFTCVQVAFFIRQGAPALSSLELRIYDLSDVDGQGGGDGTIAGLGDFNLAVPKCSLTYSVDDGSLIICDLATSFLGTFKSFDGIGEVCDLSAGHYGFHIMLPGIDEHYFWTTAPRDDSECIAVWGPAAPFPVDYCGTYGPEFQAMHFNMRGAEPCEQCPFDVNDDGQVGAFDLANLLGAWGECAGEQCLCVDANADGQVDAFDLANLLGVWGPCS